MDLIGSLTRDFRLGIFFMNQGPFRIFTKIRGYLQKLIAGVNGVAVTGNKYYISKSAQDLKILLADPMCFGNASNLEEGEF
jgi:hypothetical protein